MTNRILNNITAQTVMSAGTGIILFLNSVLDVFSWNAPQDEFMNRELLR